MNYRKIIFILCLISSLPRFVLDSYLPSLPAIGEYFEISDVDTQLTLTLYLLGFGVSQLVYGPLSDRYGRRIIMLIGLGIFVVGNLMCAIANLSEWLLFGRLIAGVGAGACGVLNRAIASDCFKGAEFSKAWSYTTNILVITLCVAPVLGGYIQAIWDWRVNFAVSTAFSGVVFFVILKYLSETNLQDKSKINFNKILQNYYSILITPSFLTGALCYTLSFSGLIAYFQVTPLLLINHFGLSPIEYGWCSLFIAGNYLIGGLIVNRFAHRVGTHSLLLWGSLLLIIGGLCMWLAHLFHYHSVTAIVAPAALYVIGARIVIPNAIANSMEKVRHLGGSSSALIGCIQMLGAAIISFWIASFDYETSLPLAIFLTALGCLTYGVKLFLASPSLKKRC